MDSDAQDILGQPTLPAMEGFDQTSSSFSPLSTLFTLVLLLGLSATALSLRRMFLENREKSLKLATRRRLGIPDNDRRPFNVAYAAAMLAKEDREKNERSKPRRQAPERPIAPQQQQQHQYNPAPLLDQHLRNRSDRYRSATALPFPGAYTSYSSTGFTYLPPQEQPHNNAQPGGSTRHAARKIVDLSSEVEPRKRGHDDSDADLDDDARKSRRVEGDADDDEADDDELMDDLSDVPEEAAWEDYETALSHQRPQKRGLGDGGEAGRDKRARKASLVPEDMEVDGDEEQDELRDLLSPVRGKKRDRAEAGSTFGGDDDDSAPEDERLRRSRRKRRTVWKRKSDAGIGSRKRDREMDVDEDFEGSVNDSSQRKHKKGKRHSRANGDRDDISVNDSLTSSASKSRRGRKVGEEWESNGVRYKLGPDGERLQQALVKRARHKFVMPKDSEHPDKDENLEVFVETWLTDSEYIHAKDQKLLAWQDTPKKPEPENLSVKIPATTKPAAPVGKNLLWTTASSTPAGSPASISPLDSPSLRGSGLRTPGGRGRYSLGMNPFEKQPDISTKRIISASIMNGSLSMPTGLSGAAAQGLTDSTNLTVSARPRTLSKWERQEGETEAILRLRAKHAMEQEEERKERERELLKEQELKERLAREKAERERAERERVERERAERERKEAQAAQAQAQAAAAQAAVVVPKITVTTPSSEGVKPAGAAPGGFSFAPPPAAAPAAAAAPQAEKKNIGAGLASTFFAPPSASSATPAAASSSTPAATPSIFGAPKTEGAPAASGFSFAKPAGGAAPPAPGGFSFGPPKTEEKKPEAKPATTFSFPTSTTTPGGAASAFGVPPAAPSATAKPKFDFMGGSKPAGDAAPSAAATIEAKPTGFSFGAPSTAAATTTTPAAPAPIKFSFSGTPASTPTTTNGTASAFGVSAPSSATTNGAGSVFGATSKPAGSVFGPSSSSALGGALGGASNAATAPAGTASAFAFGDKGKAPAASGFGTFGAPAANAGAGPSSSSATVPSAFGGVKTESAFGVKPATDSGAQAKPTFSFGPTPAAATTTPKFGFGSGPAGATTTPAGAPAGGFGGFNFGATAKPAGSAAPAPAAAAPAPASGFSFGAPPATGGLFGAGTTTPAGGATFQFGKK